MPALKQVTPLLLACSFHCAAEISEDNLIRRVWYFPENLND
jgi:hypothetical protein